MQRKTPQEVRRSLAADFKIRGITHQQAAEQLHYRNKQSVTTIISKKSESYLPFEQAQRFHTAFGYSLLYLMTGEGLLYQDAVNVVEEFDPMEGQIDIQPPYRGLSKEVLTCIIKIAEGIIDTTGSTSAKDAWISAIKGDYEAYKMHITDLAKNSGDTMPPIIPQLAKYTINKIGQSMRDYFVSDQKRFKEEQNSLRRFPDEK